MIDIKLVEEPVDVDKFSFLEEDIPTLFLGFAIKNEYDHQRLAINEEFTPKKVLFTFKDPEGDYKVIPLYGIFLSLNKVGRKLANTLEKQSKDKKLEIKMYEKILEQYNLTCKDSYSYLNKQIFPIDFKEFSKLTDNPITNDKKILQHLLKLDEDEFNFQQFGSFKLLILTY